jgi:tetratricopeptide (TPR) repeat protein
MSQGAVSTIISGQRDGRDELGAHPETNPSVQVARPDFTSRDSSCPKTRTEVAHQKLLEASEDLATILQDYLNTPTAPARHNETVIPPNEMLIISGAMNPEGFASAVEKVLAKQEEHTKGMASRITNALCKMYPLISLALSLGSNAVSLGGAPFAPLQCTLNGISLLLSIAYQEHDRSDDFLKQFDRISYQSLRIAEIQNHTTLQINDLLLEKTTNLMTAIILFFKSSLMFFRHDYFYNLGRTILLGPKIYANARETLDTAIAEFDQALLLQVTVKILATGNVPKPADEHLQQSELLSWLGSSYWQVEAQFATNRELRAPGTLQWVLETAEFTAWRLGNCEAGSASGSLWLNGPAGVGKSIIAAYIAQVLQAQHPDAILLYFFCKAGDPLLDNVVRLIRTLAAQLLLTISEAGKHFQQLKDKGFEAVSVSYLFSRLITDALGGLSQQTFIIIDGLDECFGDVSENDKNENPIQILLEALQKVNAKILVSSRPTPEILHGMSGRPTRRLTFEDSQDDIERYVSMRVSKSQNLQRGFTHLGKEPNVFITEKSHGNFLWVSIVLNLLERTPSANAFHAVINSLPESLSGVYGRVLDRLDVTQTLDVTLAILEYILFSMVPLNIDQLQSAVGLLQDEILDLQAFVESNCGAFLGIVPGKDGPSVQIIHETFRSYIMDVAASGSRCFLPAKSHARLTEVCLRCLLVSDENLQSFRVYAVEHWFVHFSEFRSSSDIAADDSLLHLLFIEIHKFLTDEATLRRWMRQRCFITTDRAKFVLYADVHDEVLGWLMSDEVTRHCSKIMGSDKLDENVKAALDWRKEVIKPDSVVFATTIANNMAWVWLNTNWRECDVSRLIFKVALTTARILQLVGPPEEEHPIQWRELPNQYLDPKRAKYKGKPGYTWRYPSSISTRGIVNKEQLDALASIGGYDSAIGLQSGNYAFGCYHAESDNIVSSFQSAIDEHPDWWHLHEGLGDWFKYIGDYEIALKVYVEALKYDPKKHPSSSYWDVLATVRKNQGDIPGAVDAYRKGGQVADKTRTWWYWRQMTDIYKEQKDWENMKNIYREAIQEHLDNSKDYWFGLAEAYGKCLDWKGQLNVYFSAITADPNNMRKYSEEILSLADSFSSDCMLFPPAIEILTAAMYKHATDFSQYQKALANTYMAARQWNKARDLYEALLEGPCAQKFRDSSNDLGHAYLALGNTARALVLYYQDYLEHQANGDYSGLSAYGAPAHMLARDFHAAIRLLKADITASRSLYPDGPSDIHVAQVAMKRFFNLALCYEALNRSEDAHAAYSNASYVWQNYKDENMPGPDSNGVPIHRSKARSIMIYGYVLEKLGRTEEAKYIYNAADRIFAITTFVGDDEPLTWEHEECKCALKRVSACTGNKTETVPSLLEEIGGMRLELRLSSYYRMNWPGYYEGNSDVPRYRRGKGGYEEMFYVESC